MKIATLSTLFALALFAAPAAFAQEEATANPPVQNEAGDKVQKLKPEQKKEGRPDRAEHRKSAQGNRGDLRQGRGMGGNLAPQGRSNAQGNRGDLGQGRGNARGNRGDLRQGRGMGGNLAPQGRGNAQGNRGDLRQGGGLSGRGGNIAPQGRGFAPNGAAQGRGQGAKSFRGLQQRQQGLRQGGQQRRR